MARRSRLTVVALVALAVLATMFTLWAARATAQATQRAAESTRQAAYFLQAAQAVAAEESLERGYRQQPSAQIRAAHAAAARSLIDALDKVTVQASPTEREQVRQVLENHVAHLTLADMAFKAADAGAAPPPPSADQDVLAAIAKSVNSAAAEHRAAERAQIGAMRRINQLMTWGVPPIFLLAVALAGVFTAMLRRSRRALDAQRRQAAHDSLHDALTGLANRQLLANRLEEALTSGKKVGLVLLDLDRFKEINDALGHRCGDELLNRVAQNLVDGLPTTYTVARLGGDEFAVLLPGIGSLAEAVRITEELRAATEQPLTIGGADLTVETSAGVVISGEHGDDPHTLLQRAEIAMYVAKDRRRGLAVYEEAEDAHDAERLALLGELRRALDQQELVLYYQPKVSLPTGEVSGVEALIRWQHPQRGILGPDQFIPLAEHTGLMAPLTRYVIDAALQQMRRWLDEGRILPISVNLAARNLGDLELFDDIVRMVEAYDVPANLLCLELTESAIITEPDKAVTLLTRLHAAGIGLAVDDFGAGYTSLAQLKTLPITELKIDRSFVSTIVSDASDSVIVRSIVDLGRNLGLTTVAEGVEDAATLAALAGYGCSVAQGYHMSRPLPPEAFDRWYAERQGNQVAA